VVIPGPLGRFVPLARRDRWPVIAVFFAALVALTCVFFEHTYERPQDVGKPRGDGRYRPILATSDGHKMYLSLRSLVLDGDLDIENDARRFRYSGGIRHRADNGKPYFPHSFGVVLAWTPFFVTAHGISKIANLLGADIASHGYTELHQRITLYTAVLFAFFAAILGMITARRWLGGRWGPPLAALGVLFGSSVYYYAVYLPSYNHAADAFFSAAFLAYWALTVGRTDRRRFVWLGILLGMAAMIRVVGLSLGTVLAIELGHRSIKALLARDQRWGERLREVGANALRGLATLAVAAIAFTPQILAWKAQTGDYISSPNGPDYVHLGRPFVVEFLFSSVNGFFSTHPISYFAAIGLVVAPKRARFVAVAFAVTLLFQIYVNSCVYDWHGVSSFGARRANGTVLLQVFGLACLLARAGDLSARIRRLPRAVPIAIGVIVIAWFSVWNVIYAHAYLTGKIEKIRPRKMCCKGLPPPFSTIGEPIYDAVGNPFAWPASLLFKLKYGATFEQWDTSVGAYASRPKFRWLLEKSPKLDQPQFWNLPGANFDPWLLDGWGRRTRAGNRWVRWTTAKRASFFVPLFLPGDHTFQVDLRPNIPADKTVQKVRIEVNGETVHEADLTDRWNQVTFTVSDRILDRGTNVMTIVTDVGPFRINPASRKRDRLRPPPDPTAGVAVTSLRITLPNPHR
jgi:hypothetical protein